MRPSNRMSLPATLPLLGMALATSVAAQQPLSAPPVPLENPITAEKAVLGKILFWEEQLSSDNRMACGTCHMSEAGGTDLTLGRNPGADLVFGNADDTTGSLGVRRSDANNRFVRDPHFAFDRQVTLRKANASVGAAYFDELFWDGRATSRFEDPLNGQTLIQAGGALESQALGPILSSEEMAHDGRTWAQVVTKLAAVRPMALATNLPQDVATALATAPDYPSLFTAAYGDAAITPARIAFAIATYERTLVPDQSPFDAFLAGNANALTQQQRQGRALFNDPQVACATCHSDARLSDGSYRFIGVRPAAEDLGRFLVTGLAQDRGAFKVPSLRNVALQRSFMHGGQFSTLAEVVNFYNAPPPPQPGRDPLIRPLGLNGQQRASIVAFLQALTDPRVAAASGPFSRPTLQSERMAIGANQYGVATVGVSGAPQMISEGVPAIGMSDFRVGMHGGLPGALALFGLSTRAAAVGTQIQGVPLSIDLAVGGVLYPVTLNGSGAGTYDLSIPSAPALVGLQAHGQWFVPDPSQFYLASRAATWSVH